MLGTITEKKYGLLNFNLTTKHLISKIQLWNISEVLNLETIKILDAKNVTKVILNNKYKEFENENTVSLSTLFTVEHYILKFKLLLFKYYIRNLSRIIIQKIIAFC